MNYTKSVNKSLKKLLAAIMCGTMALAPVVSHVNVNGKTENLSGASGQQLNIKQLDNAGYKFNTEDYFDSSVTYRLSDKIASNDDISVIVALSTETLLDKYDARSRAESSKTVAEFVTSTTGVRASAQIRSDISSLKNRISKANFDSSFGEEYDVLLSGFEVVIKAKDYNKLSKLVGSDAKLIVGEKYERCESQVIENIVDIDEETGIFNSRGSKYTGSGTVIAVLDTGLDYTHSAFNVDRFEGDEVLTTDSINKIIDQSVASSMVGGLTASDVYVSKKVPFAFDYADRDSDVFPLDSSHGTHVSGVMVGNDDTIRGVAPNAQLVSMKVFSDSSEQGARSSWLLSALEDCVLLGVDVINMSLGSSCGFSNSQDDEEVEKVYNKIKERGISLVTAASNSYSSFLNSEKNGSLGLTSNPDTDTVGAPSTYPAALSVASVSGTKTPYLKYGNSIIYFNEASDQAAQPKEFVNEILGSGQASKEFDYVTIPGVGRSADYSGIEVEGKIALVKRGSTSFEDKVRIASSKKAAGIIIYNNVSGDISMTVGSVNFPACSISQDDGNVLAAQTEGKLTISKSQVAGPFMSDFSSWGPTPDLKIKPEITAHGGNILSSVPGQNYDRLSGTSMASPNQAGVTALVRQYVKEAFASENLTAVEVTDRVNQIMMSTADIVYNTNGLPYAVRKQGAGLANLAAATSTPAYISTLDTDGNVMDKAKLEVGDDAKKTGVYKMNFFINNITNSALTYDVGAIVMTEGVSNTLTVRQETVVTEQGYMLNAGVEVTNVSQNGSKNGNTVTVSAKGQAKVEVTVTLTDADKEYLNKSFSNGMFIEGFVTLTAKDGSTINLNVPYLAFYGDWNQAPIFDLDYFETDPDEKNAGIDQDEKTMADTVATRPIGGLYQDYITYLGAYTFTQAPGATQIAADRDRIALSNQATGSESSGVNSISSVWAGMLRGADRVDITVTDSVTGEVIYAKTDYNVHKSYNSGGSISASQIDVDFELANYDLKNNTKYDVLLQAYTPFGDGGASVNKRNTFAFSFTTDFQAPAVTDCNFYTEYDSTTKKTRLFAQIDIYDNHYSQAAALGTIVAPEEEGGLYSLTSFDRYLTPLYSSFNSTYTITYELTDHLDEIKASYNKNSFFIQVYDYALNASMYEISIPDDVTGIIDFLNPSGQPIGDELALSVNEVYNIDLSITPGNGEAWWQTVSFVSDNPAVADVVNGKIIARSVGTANIIATANRDASVTKTLKITVTDDSAIKYDKPVTDSFVLTDFYVNKAFYFSSSDSKDIGETGNTVKFNGNYSLTMYPSESVTVHYDLKKYFPDDTTVVFKSSNPVIVEVDENGRVTAKAEGNATISVSVLLDGKSTYYSQTIIVTVKNPYVTNGSYLMSYFGDGETIDGQEHVVSIPKELGITEIYSYAFANYQFIPKDENDEISKEDPYKSKQVAIGENTIRKVIIPEGVKVINSYAFARLVALEEVVLPSTLNQIQSSAFYGCTKLNKINLEKVQFINMDAFHNCPIEQLKLDSIVAIGNRAFAFDQKVTTIDDETVTSVITTLTLPASAQSLGSEAFFNNTALSIVAFNATSVKLGDEVFAYCTSLAQVINLNTPVIPASAFQGCSKLATVTLGADVSVISRYAFIGTAISRFGVVSENPYFAASADGSYLTSKDGTTLVLVAPGARNFRPSTAESNKITAIGDGAFSGNTNISAVSLPNVTSVGSYAFAECSGLISLTLGELDYIGEGAFGYCTKLLKLPDFGENLTSIGAMAFYYCTSLTRVEIPDNVTIGTSAFYGCDNITYVKLGNNVTVGNSAFFTDISSEIVNAGTQNGYYLVYEDIVSNGSIKEIEAGNNVKFGAFAFAAQFNLTGVSLGEGAEFGDSAFYLDRGLKEIDLSKALIIGDNAFAGFLTEVYALDYSSGQPSIAGVVGYMDISMGITSLDLSSATYVGENAFSVNTSLVSVTLGDGVKAINGGAFAYALSLESINLNKVEYIGEGAFESAALLEQVDLSSAKLIGSGAFYGAEALNKVTLGSGVTIGALAFYNDQMLTDINLVNASMIGDYAFCNTGIQSADLSNVVYIGDYAFMSSALTDVKFGPNLWHIGENPFADCKIAAFTDKDGKDTFTVSESIDTGDGVTEGVFVEDGVLYKQLPNGLVLVSYPLLKEDNSYKVKEGTIRISAMAFIFNEGIVTVELPYELKAIGDKAWFGCENLTVVVFTSVSAPILEETYDENYQTYSNLPHTGYFSHTDEIKDEIDAEMGEGYTEATYKGLGIVPFYCWDNNAAMYFYGSNFVNYIGKITKPLVFVTPKNGEYYDAFVISQYYSTRVDGAVAPYQSTLDVIALIDTIPSYITLEDEAFIASIRAAYEALSSLDQRALVSNYSKLTAAELTIEFIKPTPPDFNGDGDGNEEPETGCGCSNNISFGLTIGAGMLLTVSFIVVYTVVRKKRKN